MRKNLEDMSLRELGMLFPIIITEHDAKWKKLYEKESIIIKDAIKEENIIRINHFGSTAISDLPAKPTIDILLEVEENIDQESLISKFKSLGYYYTPQPENPAPNMMFMKGYTPNGFKGQAYHIHVRYKGDWDELYFRDYLLKYSNVAKEYGDLKYELMKKYKNDREAYTGGKTEFIKRITKKAREEFGNKYEL